MKQLNSFDWGGGGAGRPQKYPWGEWENGKPWEIVKGEDYHVSSQNMQVNLHMRAAKDNKVVRTRTRREVAGEKLVFQFFEKPE
jgi:hypothetical protein